MECRLDLNETEWKIMLELLERERADLHPEVRHTDNRECRHQLHDRLKAVQDMIERLQAQAVTQP